VEFETLLIPIKTNETVNFPAKEDSDESLHEKDVITLATT